MSNSAAVAAPPHHSIAAILNVDDPNERRIVDCLHAYYDNYYRLHAMRRGSVAGPSGPIRMLWTLSSFHPARKGARVEWSVTYWHIDEIAMRFQRCPDEATARAVYARATHPDAGLPGLKMDPKR